MQLDFQQLLQKLERIVPPALAPPSRARVSLISPPGSSANNAPREAATVTSSSPYAGVLRSVREFVETFVKAYYMPEELFESWCREHPVRHWTLPHVFVHH